MIIIRLRFAMANRTTERGVIARRGMAVGALIPFPFVFAAINGKMHDIVVESCRFPGCFAMATGAVCRELCRFMVGIGGLIIIVDMTAGTGIRSVIIITLVTGGTGIGNAGVGSFE